MGTGYRNRKVIVALITEHMNGQFGTIKSHDYRLRVRMVADQPSFMLIAPFLISVYFFFKVLVNRICEIVAKYIADTFIILTLFPRICKIRKTFYMSN